MKLVWDKAPSAENGRNSEASFLRLPDGTILFAYSRYNSAASEDAAGCDIAAIQSADEGESWGTPRIIVRARDFGVRNIMSVSCIMQDNGYIGVYFIIKENDGTSSIGRALSSDGLRFSAERVRWNAPKAYYVFNNDRLVRLSDGRLALPVACHAAPTVGFSYSLLLLSEDDGATFSPTPVRLSLSALREREVGMQEPGLIEHLDGTMRLWARTTRGSQYESYSRDGFQTATEPSPSIFTSPASPMELARDPHTGTLYAVYNPIPGYQPRSRDYEGVSMGRTPIVIRKSTDDGRTWGALNVIESDKSRGYCYPALFFTEDNALLCAYCRGNAEDGICLSRLGIMKLSLDEVM